MSRIVSLAFLIFTLGCVSAWTGASRAQEANLQRPLETYRGQEASLGYVILTENERVEVAVYILTDQSRPLPGGRFERRLVALRKQGADTKWTDGGVCPALYSVLLSLERLTPPGVEAPGLRVSPPSGYVLPPSNVPAPHSPTLVVWGSGYDASAYPVTVTFAGRGPLMLEFARNAEAALNECWRSEPPVSIG